MAVCEVLTGNIVNHNTLTAVTNATGDNNVVRSFPGTSKAYILNAWAASATAGELRIRSPRMHDNVQGLRSVVQSNLPQPLFPEGMRQVIYGQDTLTIEQQGGAAETDAESVLVYYENVDGMNARLKKFNEIAGRVLNFMTIELAITSTATLGNYVGAAALNTGTGTMEANMDYALLGYETSAAVCTVGIRGQDTGNARIGGPGSLQPLETRQWFRRISDQWDLPLIPIFNSANVGGILVDVVQISANVNPTISLFFAQLAT